MVRLNLRLDAISDQFRYDPKVGRYRWRKGTPGAGQLVAKSTIDNMLEAQVERLGADLMNTSSIIESGTSGPPLIQWQNTAGNILKKLHGSLAVLAHGGHQNMNDADWLAVARNLRREYYNGQYENPGTGQKKRYGLMQLARQIRAGNVSIPQLRYRLKLYSKNARTTYLKGVQLVQKDLGKVFCYRRTSPGEVCPDCVAYENLGIQRIEDAILPGHKSRCGPNCKCDLVYLTESEAIAQGYAP